MKQRNWITYLAGLLAIAYGFIGAILGFHGPDKMMDYFITGLGVVGIRRAIAKGQKANVTKMDS